MAQDSRNNLSEIIRKQIRRRFNVVVLLFFLPVAVIIYHIIKIQFVEGKYWRELAK
jgi:cell division protein FtsI/penicillin-binding protein 2